LLSKVFALIQPIHYVRYHYNQCTSSLTKLLCNVHLPNLVPLVLKNKPSLRPVDLGLAGNEHATMVRLKLMHNGIQFDACTPEQKRDLAQSYLCDVGTFKTSLLTVLHLSGGGPARAPEKRQTTFDGRDPHAPRSLSLGTDGWLIESKLFLEARAVGA